MYTSYCTCNICIIVRVTWPPGLNRSIAIRASIAVCERRYTTTGRMGENVREIQCPLLILDSGSLPSFPSKISNGHKVFLIRTFSFDARRQFEF